LALGGVPAGAKMCAVDEVVRAGRPTEALAVPEAVIDLAGGDPIELVWRNQLGGLTFRVAAGSASDRYVKWVALGTPEIDLFGEADRLAWTAGRIAAPTVLNVGADANGTWLVTSAISASSAVEPRWVAQPTVAVTAIGVGLRVLHDRLAVEDCPFRWDIETRLERAQARREEGEGPDRWFAEHRHLAIDEAWARLGNPPPLGKLVVCHGDACVPNTLLGEDGGFAAHVDLGHLGVADRWADLAVAAWSTEWNYGPGLDTVLYDAYGLEADPDRIAYYRLLWDLA
jgi:kanamycin kinase